MMWSDIPRHPSSITLRQFAGLWLLVFSGLGLWHLLGQERSLFGWIFLTLGCGAGIPGLIHPRLLRPIFVGWMLAVFPLGWLTSRLLLAVCFYGLFTPLAFWFRLRGRDSLRRQRSALPTYWQSKPSADGAASYYRQF
jgi:hypothetical protein